ncbi:unnamed protein product [Wuchereria bancrofti]|uniref:Large ribosomal subunit protein mL38 n=1 Tax=Wuchereria bancrofti TaxID=6293 RepID=A0A3P7F1U0_WUCBA|nr:unnamed protein product [Wuchereria bancrofti]
MKRAFRSVYADIYVKDAHRVRGTPRVARPWRPKVIAWAGPAAFYRNRLNDLFQIYSTKLSYVVDPSNRWIKMQSLRECESFPPMKICGFYEPNAWYKARIAKPVLYPKMHVIDADNHLLSLKERLAVPKTERYDIGFKKKSILPIPLQPSESKNVLKLSRKVQLTINLKEVEHWQLSIFHHYRIFDDIFHTNVFFHNTQNMQLKWGSTGLYQGNLIDAVDTSNKPDIWIQSLNGGFNSFVLLNLDGNPYNCGGEVVHWLVANIPDGKSVSDGTEIVPYFQMVPFRGTGYHRIACLLLRHNEIVNLTSRKPNSPALIDRIFNVGQLYKKFEKQWTPSALSFAQASWDVSVNEALHRIGLLQF